VYGVVVKDREPRICDGILMREDEYLKMVKREKEAEEAPPPREPPPDKLCPLLMLGYIMSGAADVEDKSACLKTRCQWRANICK
jgi:hypothetical protein